MGPLEWRAALAKTPLSVDVVDDAMAPTLRKGEKIVVEELDREPRKGEVIAYCREHLVARRYLGFEVYRGDRERKPDPAVHRDWIVGVVTAVRRDGHEVKIGRHMPLKTWWRRLRGR